MHLESYASMVLFIGTHLTDEKIYSVLDVGSYDVNGTYKKLFDGNKFKYTGLDIEEGPNVDIVVKDPYNWSDISDNTYDVIISGQCLEHVGRPWETVKEMARVVKPSGLVCIIVPSTGHIHRWPIDTYRYNPDGMTELGLSAGMTPLSVTRSDAEPWHDVTGIFRVDKEKK